MSTVILKCVQIPNCDYIIPIPSENFTLRNVYDYLEQKQISITDIKQMKYIYQGKQLTEDIELTSLKGTPLSLFVSIPDISVKYQFTSKLYTNIKYFAQQYQANTYKPIPILKAELPDKPEVIDELTSEKITVLNTNILKLFEDKDFCNLLRICINKPQLVNIASNYIGHGNITNTFDLVNLENFTYEKEYDELIGILSKIHVTSETAEYYDELSVKSVLEHFKGHLNLSLRFIIQHTLLAEDD
jgi:hypothetical protein